VVSLQPSVLILQGQIFSGKDHKIYLLGNPVIWFGLLAVMGLFLILALVHAIRRQRGMGLFLILALVHAIRRQRGVKTSEELTGKG